MCVYNSLDMAPVLLIHWQAMKVFANMKFTVLALSLVMVVGGCRSMQLPDKPASLDNAAFMSLWDAYRHCQAGQDLDAMRRDAQQLTRVALSQEQQPIQDWPFPLPDFVRRVVAPPAPRLSADPKAMAASCALATGRVALRAERLDLASDMFRAVLRNHPQPEYAYYVDQARTGLEQVDRIARFAQHGDVLAPAVIPISSAASAPRTGAPVSSED